MLVTDSMGLETQRTHLSRSDGERNSGDEDGGAHID
jgi:hypothetical protein